MIAVIVLGLLALALIAALTYREWAHDRERQELLDRLTVPEAARTAAFARAVEQSPEPPDTDAEDDAAFGREIEYPDFVPLTGDF